MKTWKEVPHLFANGKFYGLNDRKEKFLISGCIASEEFYLLGATSYRATDCTLIARRIEDMTDEEFNEWDMIVYTVRDNTNGTVVFRKDSPESFLYLLSIGCYPFDQSHFEKGEVLDAKEVV